MEREREREREREGGGRGVAAVSSTAILWHYGLSLSLSLCADAGAAGGRGVKEEDACDCSVAERGDEAGSGEGTVGQRKVDGGEEPCQRGGGGQRREAGQVWWINAVSSTAAQVDSLEASLNKTLET
jgi:hypothetical protein